MLPDQYVYGFTSKEEAENALKTIVKSINRDSFVDLSFFLYLSFTPRDGRMYPVKRKWRKENSECYCGVC